MVGPSRRACWGSLGLVVICALGAYLRTGAPTGTPTIGARSAPAPAAAAAAAALVDAVEPDNDPAAGAAVAAAVEAVDALSAKDMQVCSFSSIVRLEKPAVAVVAHHCLV